MLSGTGMIIGYYEVSEVKLFMVNALSGPLSSSERRTKRTVGAVAIALLTVLFILGLIGYLSLLEWLIGAVIIALAANLILRRIGRQKL